MKVVRQLRRIHTERRAYEPKIEGSQRGRLVVGCLANLKVQRPEGQYPVLEEVRVPVVRLAKPFREPREVDEFLLGARYGKARLRACARSCRENDERYRRPALARANVANRLIASRYHRLSPPNDLVSAAASQVPSAATRCYPVYPDSKDASMYIAATRRPPEASPSMAKRNS